jgi:FAD/FMN-containing dehydrogenase
VRILVRDVGRDLAGRCPRRIEEEHVTGISGLPPAKRAAHEAAVTRLRDAYAAVPKGVPVRLAKPTSNLFRFRDPASAAQRVSLDVSAFSRVIHVDPATRTAVVGGMTTYEDLCEATLPHGLMPLVVPELKTITLGGAVTGLGIEA